MLESLKSAIENAKVAAVRGMLTDGRYAKRSLAAIAKGIGETEDATAALIAEYHPDAVRTTGRVSGKVFYGLDN